MGRKGGGLGTLGLVSSPNNYGAPSKDSAKIRHSYRASEFLIPPSPQHFGGAGAQRFAEDFGLTLSCATVEWCRHRIQVHTTLEKLPGHLAVGLNNSAALMAGSPNQYHTIGGVGAARNNQTSGTNEVKDSLQTKSESSIIPNSQCT